GARTGDVYEYLGPTLTGVAFDYLSSETVVGGIVAGTRVKRVADGAVFQYAPAFDFVSTAVLTDGLEPGDRVLHEGLVYVYTGPAIGGPVDLSTQTYPSANWTLVTPPSNLAAENYADTTKWAPVPNGVELETLDYSDPTLWRHVGLDRKAATVAAYVRGASIYATGDLVVSATSTQTIEALVVAGAVAISGGGSTGVGVSGAGAFAQNRIATDVQALVDLVGGHVVDVASITGTAIDASGTRAFVGAASIAAGVGGSTGVAVSIGLSIALNDVDNRVDAALLNGGAGITTRVGGVTLRAETQGRLLFTFSPTSALTSDKLDDAGVRDSDDLETAGQNEETIDASGDAPTLAALAALFTGPNALSSGWQLDVLRPGSAWRVTDALRFDGQRSYLITFANGVFSVSAPTIDVVAAAASLAVAIGGSTGVAISGAGAVAINVVTSRTNAHIDDSVVTSAQGISLTALGTNAVTATVAAIAAAVGLGGSAGIGVAIGISIARNMIGHTLDGTMSPTEIQAYAIRSSLTASNGPLTATATATHTISAIVISGSVAIAASGTAGVGVAGSGVFAENRIATHVKAFVDGGGIHGASADSITLSAHDTSTISAIAGAAAIAAAFGSVGVAVSIGVSLAFNSISNEVEAYLAGSGPAGFESKTGDIVIDAVEHAGIRA
ncbi:MAG TPA: hypothetical protein VGK49_10415, partial [Ilumatobacteraceae bacterium]